MAFLQDWLRRPQRVWLRRAIFQVHLWTGIAIGLYIVAVCVSGSVVVFRIELDRYFTHGPRQVEVSGRRLSDEALGRIAKQNYPAYSVSQVWPGKKPTDAVEIWLNRIGTERPLQREFDPYTGRDLGDRRPVVLAVLAWLIKFHGNLGFGDTGRIVNGAGGFVVAVLCLTGLVIWWPGIGNWRRSVLPAWRGDWKRFNWELHSTVGFWMVAAVFLFAITGAYVVFTEQFERAINSVSPLRVYRLEIADTPSVDTGPKLGKPRIDPDTFDLIDPSGNSPGPKPSFGDELVRWAPRLHYGRYWGVGVKALWAILGLAPPILFCTGALMWWNRVLRPEALRARRKARIPKDAISIGQSTTAL
jgi:uncharacterized iron-regulated membrane protein